MRIERLNRLLSAPLLALLIGCGGAPAPTPAPAAPTAPASAAATEYKTYPLGAKYQGEHEGKAEFGHTIRYFTPEERIAHTLHPCGGKLCDPQGKPLDPEVATHPQRSGTLLYAMTGDGTLLGTFDAELHVVHHSSLNAGGPVACAGEMMSEAEFLTRLVERTGCGLLLDLNNVYVSAANVGGDAATYLPALPAAAIGEIHLAGHTNVNDLLIDTHSTHISDAVWALYADTIARIGARPTLIEWDRDVPDIAVLLGEAQAAQAIISRQGRPHAD
jgi:hypothetical protein